MLCVADIGNTQTVLGLFDGPELIERWRLRTDTDRTVDEWGLTLKSLFDLAQKELSQVDAMAIASVVPQAIANLETATERYFHVNPLVVGPGVKTGLAIRLENPREMGADRVVNAVAALDQVSTACIVVDFGTATTFDCLSQNGEYLGGAIAPGVNIALNALVSRAAKLPRIDLKRPRKAIGRNTEESMKSGVLFGYASLVDGLVDRLSAEMTDPVEVIATGGLAESIAAECRTIGSVVGDLTLIGLRLIYQRNQP